MAFRELPTFYYHTHFLEFLDFVRGPCANLLNNQHRAFLQQFDDLSHSEQCLVVRIINRKYSILKKSSLLFAEIPDSDQILETLSAEGFTADIQQHNSSDLLQVLTKPELLELYQFAKNEHDPKLLKSANKAICIEYCSNLSAATISKSDIAENYVVRQTDPFIDYFLFLFFGHGHGKLNQFSMRDLGIMKTRDEQAQMQSRYLDYKTAFSAFSMQQASLQLKQDIRNGLAKGLQYFVQFAKQLEKIEVEGLQAQTYEDKIKHLVAKHMLAHDPHAALDYISDSESPLCLELWCRQAYKYGCKEELKNKLHQIIDKPVTDKILHFAEDYLARKYHQKRTSVLTDMLREKSQHLFIDEIYKGNVEQGVIAYYESRGLQAWRTENFLWHNLFGLCFWHELFELEGLGLATPFDYLPVCLKQHQFIEVAESQIKTRLEELKSSSDLLILITKNITSHYGKSQGIVHWHNTMIDSLKVLIEHSKLESLKSQLLNMCSNWRLYNDGYPDIMVLENGNLRFEEIKAQGDSLRRNQLMQIQCLGQFGFEVAITTVDWAFDPMQAYVVVDIETTGGRSDVHKITEVGMVKMVNGKIVEQWQSLINPERRIPSMITNLTGITNDMVADAPLFVDVADEIEAFSKNCIFVAHNVNFDYGFIKEEFSRIGRFFRRPKLCTVQQMRRYYKGLPSYSLANLSKHFDIQMQRHHRALSDALAASELLQLVNQARQYEEQSTSKSEY